MKQFLASNDIKLKDIASGTTGAAVTIIATVGLREQQLSRKALAEQSLAEKNRNDLGLISHVRRNVKDGVMSKNEALNYCRRDGICTDTECLGSVSGPIDTEEKKKSQKKKSGSIDPQGFNKNRHGGGKEKINNHKKISKDNQINSLFDSETQEWLLGEGNSPCKGLVVETSELNYTRPKSEMAGIAVSASSPISSESKSNEVWVLPVSAPFIAGVAFMVLYSCFIQIKNKNPRIKNFFATDIEKILENQNKIQKQLDDIYYEQKEIKKKLRN